MSMATIQVPFVTGCLGNSAHSNRDIYSMMPQPKARPSPYSTGLKPEAIDKFPPMDPSRLISRPEPGMGESAKRLFTLKWWLKECLLDKKLDAEVYTTECRLREQAAFIIGYLA